MLQVFESPMRYYFCSETCTLLWRKHRHDADVVTWLRVCTGDRHKILNKRDEGT